MVHSNGSLSIFFLPFVKHSKMLSPAIKNEIIPFCGSSRLNLKPYVICLSGKKEKIWSIFFLVVLLLWKIDKAWTTRAKNLW